jgi:hypothetical protein
VTETEKTYTRETMSGETRLMVAYSDARDDKVYVEYSEGGGLQEELLVHPVDLPALIDLLQEAHNAKRGL